MFFLVFDGRRKQNAMATRLVQMCASHIVSTRRLRALVRMLRSIADQSVRAPMWLSVSCGAPEMQEEAAAALSAFDINVRWRERAMSQFEHYALLASEVENEYAWCILCDDDDYCHPNRVAWYKAAIESCDADADAVLCSNGTLGAMFPGATELDLEGLEISADALDELLTVDDGAVREQLPQIEEHLARFGDALPDQRQARVITEGLSPYRILRVNGAWSEMCGFHPDEAVGCTFGIIQGSATSKRTLAELGEKLRAGRAATSVLVNYRMNGEPFINFLQVCCVCLAMLLCAGAMPWCVG